MLILNMAAQWEFLADSTEALEPKDIPHDVDVYISTEETFLDPLKKKVKKPQQKRTTQTKTKWRIPSKWLKGCN